eukprot:gene131-80_t
MHQELRHWKLLPMRYHAGDIDTYKRKCEGASKAAPDKRVEEHPDSLSPVKTDSLTSLQSNPNMYISKVIDIHKACFIIIIIAFFCNAAQHCWEHHYHLWAGKIREAGNERPGKPGASH